MWQNAGTASLRMEKIVSARQAHRAASAWDASSKLASSAALMLATLAVRLMVSSCLTVPAAF